MKGSLNKFPVAVMAPGHDVSGENDPLTLKDSVAHQGNMTSQNHELDEISMPSSEKEARMHHENEYSIQNSVSIKESQPHSSHAHTHGHSHRRDHHDHGGHDHNRHHDHGREHHHHGGCHSHSDTGWHQYAPHSHSLNTRLKADKHALTMALLILALAFVLQLGGAIVAKSSLLAVESLHSLVDGVTVILSLISTVVAASNATGQFTYGFGRAEILSGLLSLVALALLCIKLGIRALRRVMMVLHGTSKMDDVNGRIVVLTESITLVANIGMALVLSRHHDSINVRAVRAHVVADSLENIIVLFAGVIMWAVPNAAWVDPALTIVVVLMLLALNWRIAIEIIEVLMQAAPKGIVDNVYERVGKVESVTRVSEAHVWTVTTGLVVGSVKVSVDDYADVHDTQRVRRDVTRILKEIGVTETCVEVYIGSEETQHLHSAKDGRHDELHNNDGVGMLSQRTPHTEPRHPYEAVPIDSL